MLGLTWIERYMPHGTCRMLRLQAKLLRLRVKISMQEHEQDIMDGIFTGVVPEDRFEMAAVSGPGLATRTTYNIDVHESFHGRQYRQGIRVLLSLSLIQRNAAGQSFSMHRLIHAWAFDRLSSQEKSQFATMAKDILIDTVQPNDTNKTAVFHFRRLSHIWTLGRHL